jgi:parallel beta-helix repeat protein
MTQNETATTTACIVAGTAGITVDCQGFTITLNGGSAVPAIDVNSQNITIRNCVIAETSATNVAWGALHLRATANNTTVTNTNISSAGHYAIYALSSYNSFTDVRALATTQNVGAVRFDASSFNHLANMVINKTATANTYALYWNTGDSNALDNVFADGSAAGTAKYGAYLNTFTNGNLTNCEFNSLTNYAVWLTGGSTGNNFSAPQINTSGTAAAHGFYIDLSSGNSISDASINSSGVGIYIVSSSGATNIQRAWINSTASSGIYIQASVASDANIINGSTVNALNYPLWVHQSSYNLVYNSTFISAAGHAFYTDTGTNGNVFVNNTFQSRFTTTGYYGMYFVSDSSYNLIENNTIWSPTYYAIYFGMSSSYNNISRNSITASANAGYGVTFAAIPADNNQVIENNIVANGFGIQIMGDYNNVSGNNVVSNASSGIYLYLSNYNTLESNNVTAVNNGIYLYTSTYNNITNSNYTTNSSYTAYLATNADYNRFAGNVFNQTSGTALDARIGTYIVTSNYNWFENGTIWTYGSDAVRVTTSANNNVFSNNIVYTNATNYYGVQVTTNCQYNQFNGNNITSEKGYGVLVTTTSKYNTFNGGFVDAYRQTGITVQTSSTYNNFSNMNVRTGINANGGYGLYLTGSANNNKFTNMTFASNATYCAYLYNVANNNEFSNVSFFSNTSIAIYMLQNVQGNVFRNFSATSNNTYALDLNGNGNVVNYNSFRHGYLQSNSTAGGTAALYLYNAVNYNNFTNMTITNLGGMGVYFYVAANNIFNNTTINAGPLTNAYGMQLQTLSQNNQLVNSVINTAAPIVSGGYDMVIGNLAAQPSSLVATNTSFDTMSGVNIPNVDTNSYLNLTWYLRANVSSLAGAPVEGTSVAIYNANGALVSNNATDSSGLTPWVAAMQYKQTQSGSGPYIYTLFYPYNFTATIGAVSMNDTLPTLTASTVKSISMNATACGVLSSDYTLTNPVYGGTDCFTAAAYGLTLDCNGYAVNYSRTGAGCGLAIGSFTNITARNCAFAQGAFNSSSSASVCLSSYANATIANSTFSTQGGANGYAFSLSDSFATALNDSFAYSSALVSGASLLHRKWYVSTNVTDLAGNQVMSASLNITDAQNTTIGPLAVSYGAASVPPLTQYMQGASGATYYSNYSFYSWVGNSNRTVQLNLTTNSVVSIPINASTCGVFTASMTLKNGIYSPGTCLVAGAHSLTVNCNGYSINYSQAGNGHYGIDTAGYNNIEAINCSFVSGNASAADSYAVYINNSADFRLHNSTVEGRAARLNTTSQAQFIGTRFDNGTVDYSDALSTLTSKQYAYVHAIGLAGESVNGSAVNATDAFGSVAASGTTDGNGTVTFLLTQFVQDLSGLVPYDPYNFTAAHPETQVVNYTYTPMNESKDVTIGLISANIAIDSPNAGQIFIQGDPVQGGPVNIVVNETRGQGWIDNVTVQVQGDPFNYTYQAVEVSPNQWGYNYTIDLSQVSATLTIVARGYNGTAFVSATRDFVVTRSSGSGVLPPVVSYFCPDYTYLKANSTENISISADLDTVLYSMSLNVTYPNGSSSLLSPIASSSGSDYVYNRTWQLSINQTGNYTLYATVTDVNGNNANSTRRIYSVPQNVTASLSANGPDALYMNDVCSGRTLFSGANLTGVSVAPGNYTMVAEEYGRAKLSFLDFNVTSASGVFLNYSRESAVGLLPPTNRRNVLLFSTHVLGGRFSSVDVRMNYSSEAGSLVAEYSLDAYACADFYNCTWSAMNYTLSVPAKIMNASVSNLSGLYGIFEPAYQDPIIIPINVVPPQVALLAPSPSYAIANSTITVYLNADLDANLSGAWVNITYPGGSAANLTNLTFSNGTGYTYNLTYSFVANETGTYYISARVNDTYHQNGTAIAQAHVLAAAQEVNITSYGVVSSLLLDQGIGATVLSGAGSMSGSAAVGNYTARLGTQNANASFDFYQLEVLGGNFSLLNFSELSLLTAPVTHPANRSALYLFDAAAAGMNYSGAGVRVNYTQSLPSIISEVALEAWHCGSIGNCTSMSRVNATIDTALHTATLNLSEVSGVYGIYQPLLSITTPVQAPLPVVARFTANRINAAQNANVTVYLDLEMGANLSLANVSVARPSGGVQFLSNSSYANGTNHTYNLTYTVYTNESGTYSLSAFVRDVYAQNTTANATFFAAANDLVMITSYGLDNSSLIDPGTGAVAQTGGNLLAASLPLGNYTFAANASIVNITLYQLQVTGVMNGINHTNLSTSAVAAPANRSGLCLFSAASLAGAAYGRASVAIRYGSLVGSIVSEASLEVWQCESVANCSSMERVNATIDSALHTATFNLSTVSGVYGLYQPLHTVSTSVQAAAPQIALFAPSRASPVRNTNVTVYLNAALGAQLSSAVVTVAKPYSGLQTLVNATYSNGTNYTYNYTYVVYANEPDTYTLTAVVTDIYGQNATATSSFDAQYNTNVVVTSYGMEATRVVDSGVGTALLSGGNVLSGSIPPGTYTYAADARNVTFTLLQLPISASLAVLNYTNWSDSAIPSLNNRSTLYVFSVGNLSAGYSHASAAINYTWLSARVISEPSLEVWQCPSVANCSGMSRVDAAIDTASDTVTFNMTDVSGVYGLYQPSQTVTQTVHAGLPVITRLAPSAYNTLLGENVTIYLDATLSVNLSSTLASLSYPSGAVANLTNVTFANGSGYDYNYTYAFIANETGRYGITATVYDIYGQNATANASVWVAAANESVSIASPGANSSLLYDSGMGTAVLSGNSTMEGNITPGNYSAQVNASSVAFSFTSLEVQGGNHTLLSFSSLATGSATAPANRSEMYAFSANATGMAFGSAGMEIDYSALLGGVVSESALEVWACESVANCSNMTKLSAAINTASDKAVAQYSAAYGVYGLYQASQTVTVTETVTNIVHQSNTNTVTKEVKTNVTVVKNVPVPFEVPVEVSVPSYTTVRLLSGPQSVEMHPGETTNVEITVQNSLGKDIGTVTLTVQHGDGVEASLSRDTFTLASGASEKAMLAIKASAGTGSTSVRIAADAPSIKIKDEMSLAVMVSAGLEKDKLAAQQKIEFAKKLIADNPECLDLQEGLASAAMYIGSGKYASAEARAQSTISSCSGIMALRGKAVIQTEKVPQVDLAASLAIPVAFMGAAGAAALVVFMFAKSRERRKRDIGKRIAATHGKGSAQ